MNVFRVTWKIIIGGLISAGGWSMAAAQLNEVALTGSAVIGVALLAVGVSVLAGAFD